MAGRKSFAGLRPKGGHTVFAAFVSNSSLQGSGTRSGQDLSSRRDGLECRSSEADSYFE